MSLNEGELQSFASILLITLHILQDTFYHKPTLASSKNSLPALKRRRRLRGKESELTAGSNVTKPQI